MQRRLDFSLSTKKNRSSQVLSLYVWPTSTRLVACGAAINNQRERKSSGNRLSIPDEVEEEEAQSREDWW